MPNNEINTIEDTHTENIVETHNESAVLNAEGDTHSQNEAVATTEAHEETGNGAHSGEHTLFAEPIFHIGNFTVTNSILNSWIAVFVIILLSLAIRGKAKEIPRGIQNAFEMVIEGFLGIFDSVTGSRKHSLKFFPIVFSFFVFILVNNWLGLLPGIGSIGTYAVHNGEKVFIPLFRGGTADLNTTLALALIGVVTSHIFGIVTIGAWNYFNKFINIKAFLEIPKKFKKEPTIAIINPIKFFVGLIEIAGEMAKVASLSFRLFGNIYAGEVLLASMAALFAFGLPVPFMFLEVVVGLIQALIFSVLVLAYLTMSTSKEEH